MSQESRTRAAARGAWPDFSLGVELDRQGPEFRNMLGGGISLSLPIFSRNQDEIQRAEAELETARLDEQTGINVVATSVRAAYEKYRKSLEIIRSLSGETLRNANEIRQLSARSFLRGTISLVEYLETERIVNDAITSYNTALSKFAVNQIELERAVGTDLFEENHQ